MALPSGGGGSSTTEDEDTFTKTFELDSHSDIFPPQDSKLVVTKVEGAQVETSTVTTTTTDPPTTTTAEPNEGGAAAPAPPSDDGGGGIIEDVARAVGGYIDDAVGLFRGVVGVFFIGTASAQSAGDVVYDDTFNFDNKAHVELEDGATYRLEVVGPHGDVRLWTGYVAAESTADSVQVLTIYGPGGTIEPPPPGDAYDPDDYGPGGIGDIDGDYGIDEPPPLENPTFEIPDNDTPIETPTYLQTGVFEFLDEGTCVGIRYWDPNYETTSIEYDFNVGDTQYSDTISLDEPVGYYEECISETSTGSEIPEAHHENSTVDFGGTIGGEAFNSTYSFGENFEVGDFSSGTGGGGFSAPIGGGGGPSGPPERNSPLGLLFLAGSVAGSYALRRFGPSTTNVPARGRTFSAPVSPVTAGGAATATGVWATNNVPEAGPAIGIIGLIIFAYYDVLGGDIGNISSVIPGR